MNPRETTRLECFRRMAVFGRSKAAQLREQPADRSGRKIAKATARAKFAHLETLIMALQAETAKFDRSGQPRGTTNRAVLRDALLAELRDWHRTAVAVADELHRPDIVDLFHVPHAQSDLETITRANAFLQAILELSIHAAFVEHGMDEDAEAILQQHIDELQLAWTAHGANRQTKYGAMDAIETLVNQGMRVRKGLDALIYNLFRTDAASIGEWARASHVERHARANQGNPEVPAPDLAVASVGP